MDGFLSRSG